jgi:hypothetical protein
MLDMLVVRPGSAAATVLVEALRLDPQYPAT